MYEYANTYQTPQYHTANICILVLLNGADMCIIATLSSLDLL